MKGSDLVFIQEKLPPALVFLYPNLGTHRAEGAYKGAVVQSPNSNDLRADSILLCRILDSGSAASIYLCLSNMWGREKKNYIGEFEKHILIIKEQRMSWTYTFPVSKLFFKNLNWFKICDTNLYGRTRSLSPPGPHTWWQPIQLLPNSEELTISKVIIFMHFTCKQQMLQIFVFKKHQIFKLMWISLAI